MGPLSTSREVRATVSSRESGASRTRDQTLVALQLAEGLAQERGQREVLVARGGDDQGAAASQPAAREGQQAQAHLVGPVQVLERRDERPLGGEVMQHLDDGLEQAPGVGVGARRGRPAADLGEEPRQLRPPDRREPRHERVVVGDPRAPQRIDPRGEGQRLLGLVASSEHHLATAAHRDRRDLRRQPALADARLSEQGDETSVAGQRSVQRLTEDHQLALPTHERRLRRRRDGSRGGAGAVVVCCGAEFSPTGVGWRRRISW